MHPLIAFVAGALAGAAVYFFMTRGLKERFEQLAFGMGLLAVFGGGAYLGFTVPALVGLDMRTAAIAGMGLSLMLGGCNLAVLAMSGSSGFSPVRIPSMIATVAAAILLSFCLPYLRPV